jgi:hypothetical protein
LDASVDQHPLKRCAALRETQRTQRAVAANPKCKNPPAKPNQEKLSYSQKVRNLSTCHCIFNPFPMLNPLLQHFITPVFEHSMISDLVCPPWFGKALAETPFFCRLFIPACGI